jgi:hypothetical protein
VDAADLLDDRVDRAWGRPAAMEDADKNSASDSTWTSARPASRPRNTVRVVWALPRTSFS